MKNNFAQLRKLTTFYLRKDIKKLLIWLIALVFFTVAIIAYFPSLYSSAADKIAIIQTMNSPAMIAMVGPFYGTQPYTIGALTAQQMFVFTVILAAAMNINIVLKNTRQLEEDGILEMINSFVVGRQANIMAVFMQLVIVNLICALLISGGLAVLNIPSIDLTGSFIYGFTMQLVGLVFGCFAIVFALLANNTRVASFLSYGFLGGMYLVRAITDITNDNFTWLSPIGWATKTEVFVNNKPFSLVLCLISVVILLFVSFALNKNRDIGSGLLSIDSKVKKTSPLLKSAFGFTFYLEKFVIMAWVYIAIALGVSYGSVFGSLDSFMKNQTIATILEQGGATSMAISFIPIVTMIIVVFATIPSVSLIIKLNNEEKNERIEQLYALPLSRNKLLLNQTILAVIVSACCIFLGALATWFTNVVVMSNPIGVKSFIESAIAYYPAMLFFISIAVFLLGWLPKILRVIWIYLIYSFFIVYFGGILKVPDFMNKTSPLGLIPRVPVDNMDWVVFSGMIAVSVILIVLGFIGYNKRDISK